VSVKVVLSDLDALQSQLRNAQQEYKGFAKEVAPPVADGGDGALNSSITAVADLISSLHDAFVQRLGDHADKVKYAHDSYQRDEVDVHGLFEDLMKDED
jgi:hypothetical protein